MLPSLADLANQNSAVSFLFSFGPQAPTRDSALSKLWNREHDEYVAVRAMERVRVDFTEITWEAFRRQVLDGQPAREVAACAGDLAECLALVAKSRVLSRVRAELTGFVG